MMPAGQGESVNYLGESLRRLRPVTLRSCLGQQSDRPEQP
jgi:hypothetical protein